MIRYQKALAKSRGGFLGASCLVTGKRGKMGEVRRPPEDNEFTGDYEELLGQVEGIVTEGDGISFNQALFLTETPDPLIPRLTEIANSVRGHFSQKRVDLCSIINARSGRCSEDCKFCVQSARYSTNVPTYPMKSVSGIVSAAKRAEENGAHRFCVVTSGSGLSDKDFNVVLESIEKINSGTNLKRCASLGLLTAERAALLKEAGLERFHHNLETAKSFFSQICTTHRYENRLQTLGNLEEADIERCVGGILNLGETPLQRVELAFELQALNPASVPLNFLNPRPGTPLSDRPIMRAIEAAKYLAIFRLVLPKSYLRLAGGRRETFREEPALPFKSGANAVLIGDLLTTKGPDTEADLNLLTSLGFEVESDV